MPVNSSEAIKDEKNFYKTLNKLQREMQHQKSSEFKVMSQTVFNHHKKNQLRPVNESEYLEEELGTKKSQETNTVLRGGRDTMQKTDLYHTVFESQLSKTDHMRMKDTAENISQGDISIKKSNMPTTQSNIKTVRRESVTILNNKDTAFYTTHNQKGFPTPPRGSQKDLNIQV